MILIKKGEVTFAGDAAEEMGDIDTMISMMKSETYSSMVKIVIIITAVNEGKVKKNCWNRAAEAVEKLSEGIVKASDIIAAWEAVDHQFELLRKNIGGEQS